MRIVADKRIARLKEIAPQWDDDKNRTPIDMDSIRSHLLYWWKCPLEHSWESSLKARLNGNNCPYCSNRKVLPGYNDLETTHPDLARLYSNNNELSSREITAASKKRVLWYAHGHEWSGVVREMAKNPNCRYCSGAAVFPGFNDFATIHPDIAQQWNYSRNKGIPSEYLGMSNKRVWWICDRGHEWETMVQQRSMGRGCPICANYLIIPGENDLVSQCPELMAQWHWEKNTEIDPSTLALGTDTKAWWICEKGHEWQTKITQRARGRKDGCKACSHSISKAEKEVLDYLVEMGVPRDGIEVNTRKIISPKELDIYIPSRQLAIEYNGVYWHSHQVKQDTQYHYNKWLECMRRGIRLITIWEADWIHSPDVVKDTLARALSGTRGDGEVNVEGDTRNNLLKYHVFLGDTPMETIHVQRLNKDRPHLSSERSTEYLGNVVSRIKQDLSPRAITVEIRNDSQDWRGLVEEGFSMVGESTPTAFEVRGDRRVNPKEIASNGSALTIYDTGISMWQWEDDIPLTPP